MMYVNPYEVLGVKPAASQDEIEIAYRRMAAKYHPDRVGDKYQKEMSDANRAYELLTDSERRKKYDETGKDIDPMQMARCRELLNELFVISVVNTATRPATPLDILRMMKVDVDDRIIEKKLQVTAHQSFIERSTEMDSQFKSEGNQLLNRVVRMAIGFQHEALSRLETELETLEELKRILNEYRCDDGSPKLLFSEHL